MNQYQRIAALSLMVASCTLATAGPDLVVSEITSASTFGVVDGMIAYSFGTTVCNIGDSELAWMDGTNNHPLVSQTLYKLADGQIQQLGIGFVHYPTSPLASNACGLGCTPAGFSALGAGCSSTSASLIHGNQGSLGPRSEVDPFSGFFPYPFTSIGQTGDAIYKRLQVNLADVSDPNALYFVETQVIANGELTPETKANNVSYRQVVFAPGSASASVVGPTYTQQAAIFAWRDHGNGIGMPDERVQIVEATIPGDGIIHVGSKASDQGDGTWRYDYAVHNQNANNAISTLMIPGAGTFDGIHDLAFNDVDYHDDVDGLIDGTDHVNRHTTINTFWRPLHPLGPDNLIRWGTTYSYSFKVINTPRDYRTILGVRIPGTPDSTPMVVEAVVPSVGDVCFVDISGDGLVNFYEVSLFLALFTSQDPGADFYPDGLYNYFDVAPFLSAYSAGCPE